jgi:hypothetical protein
MPSDLAERFVEGSRSSGRQKSKAKRAAHRGQSNKNPPHYRPVRRVGYSNK